MKDIATAFVALMMLTSVAFAQNGITQTDASGATESRVEFVETTMISGSLRLVGSGSYRESEMVYYSGEIVEVSESKIILRFGEEVYEYTHGDRTGFCTEGTLSQDWSGFKNIGRATVAVAKGEEIPTRIYDRGLLFTFSQFGATFIPFECGAAGSSLERDQVREIQELLSKLGYDPGPIDGLPGVRTRKAIRAFESDEGLELRGALTRDILMRLKDKSKQK